MATTLPLFWDLSSSSKKDRIDASVKLIGALEQFQAQYVPKDSPEGSDEEENGSEKPTNDGLDVLNAQDVSYSIRRLVRGLASPRESSRLGFAVALTELLSKLETVTCTQTVALLLDYTKIHGSMTGQEERDVIFARLFGFTAIIQSGLLVRQKPLPTSASYATLTSSLESYKQVSNELIALAEKKSWLRESAWWSIGLAVDAVGASDATWKEEAIEATIQSIFIDQNTWTPERFALALKIQQLVPGHDWKKSLSPTFKNPDLLSAVNLPLIAPIMKETSPDDTDSVTVSSSSWKPQLHYAWDIILDKVLVPSNSETQAKTSFGEFFRVVVDESLFSSTSSNERKYWGFQVFQKALPRVTASDLPMLFTKNFMRTWINHLSNNDRYLHKIAMQVAKDIQVHVQNNPTLGFSFILQLTGVHGNNQFDKLTKTKTVESILALMDSDGIKSYIQYLLQHINGKTTGEDIPAVNSRRAWIGDQLAALIRNRSIPKDDNWIKLILDWFIVNGLFIVKKKNEKSAFMALHSLPSPSFSDEIRQKYRERLLGCLADLTSQITVVKTDNKAQKVPAVATDGELWASKVLATIEELEKDIKHLSLLAEDDEEDVALRGRALQMIKKLRNPSKSLPEKAKGSELLLCALLIQQYCSDKDAVENETLESCIEATTRLCLSGKKSKTSRKSTGDDDVPQQTLAPIDVLVDTIIGLLERPSAYTRTVANQSFSLLSDAVQESTAELMIRQLERRDPGELVADEDEEVEGDDDSEEENSDSEAPSDDESEEDDLDDEAAVEIRAKIEEALRANGIEAATDDSDADSDDEDLMDDDQMMAIDEHLAEVFRSRSSEKSKGIDAQREATHFKNRVLDLIDAYMRRQPTGPHNVLFVLPLVEIVTNSGSDEQQLVDKTTGILKSRLDKPKEVPSDINAGQITPLLEELHQRARKARSSDTLAILSFCSLYFSKIMLQSEAEESVLRIYQQSLTDFITRKASHLNINFFQDFVRRHPLQAWKLRSSVLSVSSQATNVYRRCQVFQLLHLVTNQLPSNNFQRDEVIAFMTALRYALTDFISSACDDQVTLTAAQLKELFKLGLSAVRQTAKTSAEPGDIETIWDPNSWESLCQKLAASNRFKSSTAILKMCQQMTKTAQASSQKVNGINGKEAALKRKAEDISGGEESAPKKVRQKKSKKSKA